MKKKFRIKKFTLVEMIIIVVVIALLTGIALPKFKGIQDNAKVSAMDQDLDTLEKATEEYNIHNGEYPLKSDKTSITNQTLLDTLDGIDDDGSEVYEIDMNKLKPYVEQLKYTDPTVDLYLYSTKTNIAINKQGKKDSDGVIHHILNGINLSSIYVEEFGANGNDEADDTEAIQKAVNSNYDIIKLSKGEYLVNKNIEIPSNKRIVGQGNESIIKLIGNSGNIDILTSKNTQNVALKNFKLDGNKDGYSDSSAWTTCVRFEKCTNLNFSDLTVTGGLIEGIYIYDSSNIRLNNLYTYENGYYRSDASGLHLDTSRNVTLSNLLTVNNGFHGLILSCTSNANINNVITKNNGWDGIRVQWESNSNNFSDIQSSNNSRGIYFTTNSNDNKIVKSIFDNNKFNGITLNVSEGIFLDTVYSMNNAQYGFYAIDSSDTATYNKLTFLNNGEGDYYLEGSATLTSK